MALYPATTEWPDGRTVYFATSIPVNSDFASPAKVGDTCYNSAPAASGTFGWVCVVSGTTASPAGTWKAFATIAS